MKQKIIKIYKEEKDMKIKRKLLQLLIEKRIKLYLDDIDYKVELILEKILKPHYSHTGNYTWFYLV